MRNVLVLVLFLALAAAAQAEPVLEAAVDKDSTTVGDPIALLLRVKAGPGEEAALPEFPEGRIGPFEILSGPATEETEAVGGARVLTGRYRIAAYETGEVEIPALAPLSGGEPSRPIPITVRSVGLDPAGRPRDVKGPKEIPRALLPSIVAAAAALLLAAAAFLAVRRLHRRGALPDPKLGAADLRLAHEAALERLDRLREALERGEADLRLFHFDLSVTIRKYLNERYALPAPERTTREILREIRREKLEPEATALLRECLSACDLVKFRGDPPPPGEESRALEKARVFVEKTRETAHAAGGAGR